MFSRYNGHSFSRIGRREFGLSSRRDGLGATSAMRRTADGGSPSKRVAASPIGELTLGPLPPFDQAQSGGQLPRYSSLPGLYTTGNYPIEAIVRVTDMRCPPRAEFTEPAGQLLPEAYSFPT